MVQPKIVTTTLDYEEVYRVSKNDYEFLEILLSKIDDALEEKLMVIRELAYPLPLIARLDASDIQALHPLLQMLAVVGMERIIFNSASPELLCEAEAINREHRLGLSFDFANA